MMTNEESGSVMVNGKAYTPKAGETIAQLVASLNDSPRGIAVSKNDAVVPRSQWENTDVGGTIEIVTAAQGG